MSGLEPLLIAGAMGAAETAGVATAATAAGTAAAGAGAVGAGLAGTAAAGTNLSLGSLGQIAGIGGSVLSGLGALSSSQSTAEAQRMEAANMERQAKEAAAAAQRNAETKRRQTEIVLSRQQALSAASGGTSTDTTVTDLMSRTAGEGEYQADTIQYEGAQREAGLNYQAAIKKKAADNAITAGYFSAGSSLLSGLNQWARYRRGYFGPSYSDYAGG